MDAFEYIINRLGEIETTCLSADSGNVTYSIHDVINLIKNIRYSYNELSSAQPNLQPTCNQLATDCISRRAAIDIAKDLLIQMKEYHQYNQAVNNYCAELVKLPSAQPEQSDTSEFWRKRADYYSDMCSKLIADMGAGVKIEAVKIDETGITFTKKKPPAQQEINCSEIPNSSDTISRQLAIDVLDQIFGSIPMEQTTEILTFRRALRELPPAQQEPKWIPCSERLPEDDVEVFVYLFERQSPYIAWVEDCRWYTEDFEVEKENYPTAWMPLPEPYTERREE